MKMNIIKSSAIIFLSSALVGLSSCENKAENSEADNMHSEVKTEEVAKEQNEAKFDDNDDEKNAKFLVKAAEINLEEVALGKLAQDKSTNADVKELGKMMQKAHAKALVDLKVLAAKKGISIPSTETEDTKNAYEKLNGKEEQKDFNKSYADMMVDGHKKAVDLFEKQSTESSDVEIREWATSMLPELRTHLDQAIAVQAKCQKM